MGNATARSTRLWPRLRAARRGGTGCVIVPRLVSADRQMTIIGASVPLRLGDTPQLRATDRVRRGAMSLARRGREAARYSTSTVAEDEIVIVAGTAPPRSELISPVVIAVNWKLALTVS